MNQNKTWGAAMFNFGPTVISSIYQWLTSGHRTKRYSYRINWW